MLKLISKPGKETQGNSLANFPVSMTQAGGKRFDCIPQFHLIASRIFSLATCRYSSYRPHFISTFWLVGDCKFNQAFQSQAVPGGAGDSFLLCMRKIL